MDQKNNQIKRKRRPTMVPRFALTTHQLEIGLIRTLVGASDGHSIPVKKFRKKVSLSVVN
jgi:hypothetical protein